MLARIANKTEHGRLFQSAQKLTQTMRSAEKLTSAVPQLTVGMCQNQTEKPLLKMFAFVLLREGH